MFTINAVERKEQGKGTPPNLREQLQRRTSSK